MSTLPTGTIIDWTPPPPGGSALFGRGATRAEQTLTLLAGAAGTAIVLAVCIIRFGDDWSLLAYVLVAIIALDVLGGIVANALNAAKRDHHGPPPADDSRTNRVLRDPVLFSALHIQPIVLAIVVPPHAWWWGVGWYLATLAAVVIITRVPLSLQRPAAFAVGMLAAVVAASVVAAPPGLEWVPLAMVLKLVMAHAVREEPYRAQKQA